jgi:hypothetical protein
MLVTSTHQLCWSDICWRLRDRAYEYARRQAVKTACSLVDDAIPHDHLQYGW